MYVGAQAVKCRGTLYRSRWSGHASARKMVGTRWSPVPTLPYRSPAKPSFRLEENANINTRWTDAGALT